jgi:hypothetical protein
MGVLVLIRTMNLVEIQSYPGGFHELPATKMKRLGGPISDFLGVEQALE